MNIKAIAIRALRQKTSWWRTRNCSYVIGGTQEIPIVENTLVQMPDGSVERQLRTQVGPNAWEVHFREVIRLSPEGLLDLRPGDLPF